MHGIGLDEENGPPAVGPTRERREWDRLPVRAEPAQHVRCRSDGGDLLRGSRQVLGVEMGNDAYPQTLYTRMQIFQAIRKLACRVRPVRWVVALLSDSLPLVLR